MVNKLRFLSVLTVQFSFVMGNPVNSKILNIPPLIDKEYLYKDKIQNKSGMKYNAAEDAINESLKWQNNVNLRPILKDDGVVRFPYGEYQPIVTCKPLNLCDIELQAGEEIQGILIGDSIRWNDGDQGIPVVYSGITSKLIPHLVLKPNRAGLETTLMITTSRRTYMIKLLSSNYSYVGRTGFYYPQDEIKNYNLTINQIKNKTSIDQDESSSLVERKLANVAKLNYSYSVESKFYDWEPVEVFDDGISVFIKMPNDIDSKNLPSICIPSDTNNSDCELVNFRYREHFFIIDRLFNQVKLVTGFGSNQQTIMVTKRRAQVFRVRHRFWSNFPGG